MRRILIPRSAFGFMIRLALLYALMAAAAYAVHIAVTVTQIMLILQLHQLTQIGGAIDTLWAS